MTRRRRRRSPPDPRPHQRRARRSRRRWAAAATAGRDEVGEAGDRAGVDAAGTATCRGPRARRAAARPPRPPVRREHAVVVAAGRREPLRGTMVTPGHGSPGRSARWRTPRRDGLPPSSPAGVTSAEANTACTPCPRARRSVSSTGSPRAHDQLAAAAAQAGPQVVERVEEERHPVGGDVASVAGRARTAGRHARPRSTGLVQGG